LSYELEQEHELDPKIGANSWSQELKLRAGAKS